VLVVRKLYRVREGNRPAYRGIASDRQRFSRDSQICNDNWRNIWIVDNVSREKGGHSSVGAEEHLARRALKGRSVVVEFVTGKSVRNVVILENVLSGIESR